MKKKKDYQFGNNQKKANNEGKDVLPSKEQIKKNKQKSYFWIPLIVSGIILAAEFTVGLVSDLWFYIGAIVNMGYIVWCVTRIVSRYNRLTTRRLPQFNRTGGDDSAKVS